MKDPKTMTKAEIENFILSNIGTDGGYAAAWAILQLIKESEKASSHVATAILQAGSRNE